jgi:hypothetical protein
MGKGGKAQTIGYKYYLGMHLGLCHGPIDAVTRLSVDDREAWSGFNTGGTISVNKTELFGGEKREGGVSGTIDVEMGGPTQGQNSYLVSKLGSLIPAFRGVVGLVFRQAYLGNNPYLKTWAVRAQRIHVRQDGIEQWYDAKAAIMNENFRSPVAGDRPWTDRNSGFFTIGGAHEYAGSLTAFQGWWHGNIDSFRVTKGRARYTSLTYPVPTTPFNDDPDVVLLMHMEGEEGSTDFVDEKGHAVTVVGGPYITTTRAKFGSSSAYFDGVNDLLSVAMGGTDEDLGNAWTMEAWVWLVNPVGGSTFDGAIFGYGPFSSGGNDTVWQCMGGTTWRFGQYIASGAPPFYGALQNIGPSMEAGRWVFVSICWDGSNFWLHQDGKLLTANGGTGDMNAAHIVRECLTDPEWGMGYTDADIDDASFTAAADLYSNEGIGLSLLWDKQIKIDDFVQTVLRHVDTALYVSRTTGKFVLKPIRGGYDEGSLLSLDESNIVSVDDPSRIAFGELTNSVTVAYWDAATGKDASITVTDTALVQQQGVVINAPLQYPGFTNARNATIAGQRDLKVLSSPLLSCTITADSEAKVLNIGDVFKFSWAKWGLVDVVMRVTGISYGTGRNNRVKINCTEDVFDTDTNVVIVVSNPEWVDPSAPPSIAPNQMATEAPYFELVQALGQADIDNKLLTHPEIGYVIAAASRPASAVNANLFTDDGTGYEDVGALDFSPVGVLATDITKTQTSFSLEDFADLGEVAIGSHVQIGDELMRIDVLDDVTGAIEVGRGILDTVPQEHLAGDVALFWDAYVGFDPTEYVDTEEVDAKIVPVSGAGVLPIGEAIAMTVTMASRAARPYAPGDLRINGESYAADAFYEGEVEVTWTDRDRLQQTSGTFVDHTAGNIGPEAGTEYRLRVYVDEVLDQTIEPATSPQLVTPGASGTVLIEVHAKRDDLYSWQGPSHSFGNNLLSRLTEDGDVRYTEDGDERLTED